MPRDAKYCPFDGREIADESSGVAGRESGQYSGPRPVVRATDSLVGLVVDERYEVLQLLGEGGMGCVYRVRHRVLGRLFALKALRPELAYDFALAERFVQEARAAAAITHPNVVSITDFGILEQGQPYFVMELLGGRTLGSLLREYGALVPEFVVPIARAVASALSAAHHVGVIHRDLKPDNIILLGDATVPASLKVLDFGLAKLSGASRLTCDNIVYGTPQYMSPEQAAGEPIDARVDVYALGILMYEMLTGRVPFEADTYMGVLTKQLYAEPARMSDSCPELEQYPALQRVVMRCLQKQREARFASMHEVQVALDELRLTVSRDSLSDASRAGDPRPARPFQILKRIRRTLRQRRWLVYAAIGIVALGSALGLLFGRLRGTGDSPPDASSGLERPAEGDRIGARADIRPTRTRSENVVSAPSQPERRLFRPGMQELPASRVSAAIAIPSKNSDSGRSTGQVRGQNTTRPSEAVDGAQGSFRMKTAPGSSGMGDPWAK